MTFHTRTKPIANKNYFKAITSSLWALFILFGVNRLDAAVTIDNLSYTLYTSDMTATVGAESTSISLSSTSTLIIPATITSGGKEYAVTGITEGGFARCQSLQGTVILPRGLKSIGKRAFEDCFLKEIVISSTVTSIGQDAFNDCTALTTIVCQGYNPPKGPTGANIGTMALTYATVKIPAGCMASYQTSPSAFAKATKLTEATDSELGYSIARADFTINNQMIIIEPGTSAEVLMNMANATNYTRFSFNLQLPSGLSLKSANVNNSYSHPITINQTSQSANTYSVTCDSKYGYKLPQADGLISLTLEASSSFSGGTLYLTKATATTYSSSSSSPSQEVDLQSKNFPVSVVTIPDGITATPGSTELNQNATTTYVISLKSAKNFSYSGFQFDVSLPEGMTVEKVQFNSGLSGFTTQYNEIGNNTTRFIAYKTDGTGSNITSNLVTLTLKAGSSAAIGSTDVQVLNITISSLTGIDYQLPDIYSSIKIKEVPVTGLTLSKSTLEIYKGESHSTTITATVTPTNATNQTVNWSIANSSIASITPNGKTVTVTGNTIGSTTLTAICGSYSKTCTINVVATPATTVTLNKTEVSLKAKETSQLTVTVKPDDTTDKNVTWSTSNSAVATVSNGLVTAIAVGTATITATCGTKSATCTVTVNATPAESVTLNKTSLSLKATETAQLTATVSPETTTNKTVTWATSDSKVATVDNSGLVTAVAVGTATITATCGTKSATCTVTVVETLAESITLTPTSLTINVGGTEKLTATISPSTATNKTVTWTSSDTSIATVASDGTVTGIKAGNVTITATADGKSATAEVTVSKAPDGLVATLSETQIKQGETTTLAVSLNGAENFSYSALQFTVTLPEGITIESTNFNSALPATCNAKTEGNKSTCIISGTPDINLTSDLVTYTIKAKDDATIGQKTINISNIILIAPTGTASLSDKTCSIDILSKVIPVETIKLSSSGLDVQKGSDAVLTATIAPTDATNQEIEWIVGDKTKVSLTANGNKATITALELGETTITARAKDGSNVSATATIKVIPVPAKSITLDGTSVTILKERETNQLSATVSPAETTYPDVEWSSSDTKVATVDENGLVTAVAKGTAVITAKVTATPTVTASYSLTVEALLLGDSNEDRDVDVFDVVNIANYIVGKNPTPFCFVASDVIWDKTINVADQNATINLALGLPINDAAKAPSHTSAANSGRLNAGTVSATADGSIIVPLSISSEIAYSSLQANVILPEGMEVQAVRTTSAAASINLMYNVTADGVLRTVLYSLDNSPLPVAGQDLLEIVIDANGTEGTMLFDNVLAATPGCALYSLDADACEINVPTGADSLVSDSLIVRPVDGAIEIINAKGLSINIIDLQGRLITSTIPVTSHELVPVPNGYYIVIVDNIAHKVSIK